MKSNAGRWSRLQTEKTTLFLCELKIWSMAPKFVGITNYGRKISAWSAHWSECFVGKKLEKRIEALSEWSALVVRGTRIPALEILPFFPLIRVLNWSQIELGLSLKVRDPSQRMPNKRWKFRVYRSSRSRLIKYARIAELRFRPFFPPFWALTLPQIEVAPRWKIWNLFGKKFEWAYTAKISTR